MSEWRETNDPLRGRVMARGSYLIREMAGSFYVYREGRYLACRRTLAAAQDWVENNLGGSQNSS